MLNKYINTWGITKDQQLRFWARMCEWTMSSILHTQ